MQEERMQVSSACAGLEDLSTKIKTNKTQWQYFCNSNIWNHK